MSETPNMPGLPDELRPFTREQLANRAIPWEPTTAWDALFDRHKSEYDDLRHHRAAHQGILRSYIHDLAATDPDPMVLFLVTMAWGWGNIPIGPTRVAKILHGDEGDQRRKLSAIIDAARASAGDGWTALLRDHKVRGLGMAFGSKLIYFAGYHTAGAPRPLILDARVRRSLDQLVPDYIPPVGRTVWWEDYINYLNLAEYWAADPAWRQDPDVVEYSLFSLKGTPGPDPDAEETDADARGDHKDM